MIAALTFLHPGLLWGLALGALPILLHLLQRRRFRVRRWAAMEFLRASVRQSSRRLRIEQWLLLLVRALILILAALALARPVWSTHSFGVGTRPSWGWLGSRAAAQVVLVLDDSYSMGWRSGISVRGSAGQTQFAWGKTRALELVQSGLTPGDAVSLVLASQPARAVVRRPTFNLGEISGQLQHATLSDRGTDLGGAARLCLEILRTGRSAAREIYLISDMQAVAWHRPDVVEAWRRVAAASRLHLIPTMPARGSNLAVGEVRVGGPVAAGRTTPIQARIANWGLLPAHNIMVTLHTDGRAVATTRLDVPARGAAEARFEHAFADPGAHTVMVALPDDGLAVDNRGYLSVSARDRIRVLVLVGHPDPDPRRDAAFFVTSALAPDEGGASSPGPVSPFVLERLEGSSFRGADLSRQDVVILADVPRLTAPERRALASFAAEGGGVLILPGPSMEAAFYNGDLLTREPALMPARLGPAWEAMEAAPALDLAHVDHPALDRFRGAADVDLTTARFQRYFRLVELDPSTGARVVCRFTDGAVALAERPVGLGRVALFASPLSPGWNTLPFKPAFLPFLHGLVAYLGQGPNRAQNAHVGEPLVWALAGEGPAASNTTGNSPGPDAGTWTLEGPEGRRVTLQAQRQRGARDLTRTVRLEAAPRAGFYRLLSSKGSRAAERNVTSDARSLQAAQSAGTGEKTEAWFAANLETGESDLQPLSRLDLESTLRPAPFRWVDSHESLASVVREGRQGREAWRGLLLAAVALMLCESGMAQVFGRRRSYL